MLWFMIQNGITFEGVVIQVIVCLVIIFLILPLHEFAHGWVAHLLGDETAKNSGRLTLNPLVHIDPIGAILLMIFGFGWAKPVPVNSNNFKNRKLGMVLTALAGPFSNFLVALLGAIMMLVTLFHLNGVVTVNDTNIFAKYLVKFFEIYIPLNILLGIFNLLPIPPLDGSRILEVFLPERILYQYYEYQARYQFFMFIFIFFIIRFLSGPIFVLEAIIYKFIMWLAILPFGLH